jgi:hypothetical protein
MWDEVQQDAKKRTALDKRRREFVQGEYAPSALID